MSQCLQGTPNQRRLEYGSIVRIGIYDLARVTVEHIVRAILPELVAIEIWCGDAIEREDGDGEGELKRKEP